MKTFFIATWLIVIAIIFSFLAGGYAFLAFRLYWEITNPDLTR